MPDNVLYADGDGAKIRADLMDKCHLHTILRLPTGIFYAQGVKTNVLFFTRGTTDKDNTKEVWIYDMRTNMQSFGKTTPLKQVRPRLLLCDKAYRFRANLERVKAEYLVLALNTLNTLEILDIINQMKTGISDSGVNLTQDGFMAINLSIPPLEEQKEIVRILDNLLENEQKAKELCDVIEHIDHMKKSILARAFRGELSTNNPAEESALELLKEVSKLHL